MMVQDQHLEVPVGNLIKILLDANMHIRPKHSPFDSSSVGGINTQHEEAVRFEDGPEIISKIRSVAREGTEQSSYRKPPREDVMVSRHYERRRTELFDHRHEPSKFAMAGPLRHISTHGYKVNIAFVNLIDECGHNRWVRNLPEVKVGNVNQLHSSVR